MCGEHWHVWGTLAGVGHVWGTLAGVGHVWGTLAGVWHVWGTLAGVAIFVATSTLCGNSCCQIQSMWQLLLPPQSPC